MKEKLYGCNEEKEARKDLKELFSDCSNEEKEKTCGRCVFDSESKIILCGSSINEELTEEELEDISEAFVRKIKGL